MKLDIILEINCKYTYKLCIKIMSVDTNVGTVSNLGVISGNFNI